MGRSLLYDASDLLVSDEPVLNSENGFHSETEEPAEDEDQSYHSGEGNIVKKAHNFDFRCFNPLLHPHQV